MIDLPSRESKIRLRKLRAWHYKSLQHNRNFDKWYFVFRFYARKQIQNHEFGLRALNDLFPGESVEFDIKRFGWEDSKP